MEAAGQSQQNIRRLVRYALDGLFSFSHLPLRALTYAATAGIDVVEIGLETIVVWRIVAGGEYHSRVRSKFADREGKLGSRTRAFE